jgi:hypothetical protein
VSYEETAEAVHGLLSDLAPSLATEDGEADGTGTPVVSEWLLIVNVMDLDSDTVRLAMVAPPTMLRSHVVGLLAVAMEHA